MQTAALKSLSFSAAREVILKRLVELNPSWETEEPISQSVAHLERLRDWESFCDYASGAWSNFDELVLAEKIIFGYAALDSRFEAKARAASWKLTPQQIKAGESSAFIYFLDYVSLETIIESFVQEINAPAGTEQYAKRLLREDVERQTIPSPMAISYWRGTRKAGGRFDHKIVCEIDEDAANLFVEYDFQELAFEALREYSEGVGEALYPLEANIELPALRRLGPDGHDVGLAALIAGPSQEQSKVSDRRILLGRNRLNARQAKLFRHIKTVDFPSLDSLDVDTATALASNTRNFLLYLGLTTLTREVAAELGKYDGHLVLSRLTDCDAECARKLSSVKALDMNKLKSISPLAMEFLARCKRFEITLDELTPECAEALVTSRARADVQFDEFADVDLSLKRVTKYTASKLRGFSGGCLSIHCLQYESGARGQLLQNKAIDVNPITFLERIRYWRW